MAKLAALRFRAGQIEKAQEQADKALELFESKRDRIVNIYRAESLQPLAEAYSMMSNTPRALAVYELAVTEGVANPNSRPRAEDLSATCCSMALHAVEPGAELWERIRTIHEGLGDPW
jgi:tetratricopeptide (TPR) repeat protein